jgi:hypothetical protein
MSESTLYQICHCAQPHTEVAAGFALLEAAADGRLEGSGYLSIRRFLLGSQLDQESYYGFFPADFHRITGLDAPGVRSIIEQQSAAVDVICLSPFFDQTALYLNVVEQAIGAYPGGRDAIKECAALVAPDFRPDRDVTTSLDTIFRNCFVAKPGFWAEWLRHGDLIFARTQEVGGPLQALALEQVASLLLYSQPQWVVGGCGPLRLPFSQAPVAALIGVPDLIVLDSLKIAYARNGAEEYLQAFQQLRNKIVERHAASRAPRHG